MVSANIKPYVRFHCSLMHDFYYNIQKNEKEKHSESNEKRKAQRERDKQI